MRWGVLTATFIALMVIVIAGPLHLPEWVRDVLLVTYAGVLARRAWVWLRRRQAPA
jgi:hypothetical protein